MTIRHLFIAYVALISATAFGLNDASAAVIYEVSPATTEHTPGAGSGGMFANRTAFDSFILEDAATITSIRWLGSGSISPHTFEVGLYENTTENSAFARPLTTPLVETVSPASRTLSTQHPAAWEYQMDFGAGAFLEADTTYWLAIRNVTPGISIWNWYGDSGGSFISRDPAGNDTLGTLTLFFTLEGDLAGATEPPIALAGPPASALLALGLAALSVARVRRGRSAAA